MVSAAMQGSVLLFTFRNISAATCSLSGYPTVEFYLSGSTAPESLTVQDFTGPAGGVNQPSAPYPASAIPLSNIAVASQGTASFYLFDNPMSNWSPSCENLAGAYSMEVAPPGSSQLVFDMPGQGPPPCPGSGFTLSPVFSGAG